MPGHTPWSEIVNRREARRAAERRVIEAARHLRMHVGGGEYIISDRWDWEKLQAALADLERTYGPDNRVSHE